MVYLEPCLEQAGHDDLAISHNPPEAATPRPRVTVRSRVRMEASCAGHTHAWCLSLITTCQICCPGEVVRER